jgi:hypothetical protein
MLMRQTSLERPGVQRNTRPMPCKPGTTESRTPGIEVFPEYQIVLQELRKILDDDF